MSNLKLFRGNRITLGILLSLNQIFSTKWIVSCTYWIVAYFNWVLLVEIDWLLRNVQLNRSVCKSIEFRKIFKWVFLVKIEILLMIFNWISVTMKIYWFLENFCFSFKIELFLGNFRLICEWVFLVEIDCLLINFRLNRYCENRLTFGKFWYELFLFKPGLLFFQIIVYVKINLLSQIFKEFF